MQLTFFAGLLIILCLFLPAEAVPLEFEKKGVIFLEFHFFSKPQHFLQIRARGNILVYVKSNTSLHLLNKYVFQGVSGGDFLSYIEKYCFTFTLVVQSIFLRPSFNIKILFLFDY